MAAPASLLLLALAWRLWHWVRYFGWEESDYGNLAMARGVLESNFTRFDMNHLPLYYGLSALVTAAVDDTWLATRLVSLAGGMAAMAIAMAIAWRIAGRGAALLAGSFMVLQPELALYSASSLREPLYAAFILMALWWAGKERLPLAALAAGLAFLVRFDAVLVALPPLLLHAWGRGPRVRRSLAVLAPVVTVMGLWSAYCAWAYGTWRFWEHSVAVNLETGLGAEAATTGAWLLAGLRIASGLSVEILPSHMGLVVVLAGLVALWPLLLGGHGPGRTTAFFILFATGFWLGTGFMGQHEVGHNLYWKWLVPLVPLWAVTAGVALARITSSMGRLMGPVGAGAVSLLLVASALLTQVRESERQVRLSEDLYRPQKELAVAIEADIPEHVPMILDNIPGCWLDRRPHSRTMWTWMDLEPSGRAGFERFLHREGICYVLWFQESWTQAPAVAPWLARGGNISMGALELEEIARDDAYGWIWFRVLPCGSH